MGIEVGALEVVLGIEASKFLEGMSNAEKAVTAFVTGTYEMGKKAIEAASEAQNAASQIAGIFGKLSPEVEEFAEKLGKAAGRAASDIEGLISHFGAMVGPLVKNKEITAQMSEGLSVMAVNIEKAFHTDAATAQQALTAALAGSARGARQFGIDLSESAVKQQMLKDHIAGTAQEMSAGQKSMVMYQLIMAQQADMAARAAGANGDYSEQLQQLNAATKEAAEAFGADMLPAAGAVVGVMKNLAGVFANLSPGVRQAIEVVGGLVVGIGLASAAVALLTTELAAALVEGLVAFGAMALAAAPFIAIAGLVATVVGFIYKAWETNLGGIRDIVKTVTDYIGSAFNAAVAWVAKMADGLWSGIKDGAAVFRDVWFAVLEGIMQAAARVFKFIGETLHQDWATSISASVTGAVGSMENVRQGMTADNMGSGISSVLDKAGSALEGVGKSLYDAGKLSFQGMSDLTAKIMSLLKGAAGAGAAAPTVADLTQEQIHSVAGGAVKTGKATKGAKDYAFDGGTGDKPNWHVDPSMFEQIAKDFGSKLKSALGEAGAAIDDAIKGASIGGPVGAMAAVGADLLTKSAAFQQIMNVVNKVMQMLSDTLGQILAPILPLVGTLQNLLAPIFKGLAPVFRALTEPLTLIGGILQTLQPIFTSLGTLLGALAPIIQMIDGIIQSILVPVFNALIPVFNLVAMIMGALAPVLEALAVPLRLVGAIVQALGPLFELLGMILKGVAITLGAIMLGLAYVWNLIASAVGGAINGVISVINFFIDAINGALGWAGVHINDLNKVSINDVTIDTDKLSKALTTLTNGTVDATDAQGKNTAALDQATASLTNLPNGYKSALAIFNNMNQGQNPNTQTPQGGAGSDPLAGITNTVTPAAADPTSAGNQTGGPSDAQKAAKALADKRAGLRSEIGQYTKKVQDDKENEKKWTPVPGKKGGSWQEENKYHADAIADQKSLDALEAALAALPQMAKGGIVSKPTLALIGESGPEAVVPLGKGGGAGMSPTINVTIVSNDPVEIWRKIQALMVRDTSARFGRAVQGVPRFALPGDTR